MITVSRRCQIAVLQLYCGIHIEKNLQAGLNLLRRVKQEHPDVKMVFLPECSDYVPEPKKERANNPESVMSLVKAYQQEAKNLSTWISLGGVHYPREGSLPSMSHLLLEGGTGKIIHRYDKLHLFELDGRYCERNHLSPGRTIPKPWLTPAGLLGPCICFDLRFPQLSLSYRQAGAQILAYPSAFTRTTGEAHWHVLLRARAIENQCYVIAAAQCGNDTYGHSCVVDPWGNVIAQVDGDEVGYCIADIDLDTVDQVRERVPMHYRDDLIPEQYVDSKEFRDFKFSNKTINQDQLFFQSRHSVAFVNLKPVIDHHVLVASRRCVPRLVDLTDAERSDLINTVNIVVKALCRASASVVIQDGPEAGQTVPHVHFHILPRSGNEFGGDNDELYRQLERHDHWNSERKERTHDEMKAEAMELRSLFQ